MTLKELQNMIKEEFEAYTNEAEDDVDVSVTDNDIDAEIGDDMGAAGEEDVLRSIFDLLKTHFEGGEEEMDDEMPDMGDEEGDDMGETPMEEEVVNEDEELEENSTTSAQFQKTGMAAGGAGKGGTGYDGKAGKGGTGYDAGSKALQERFQKLANIIK